jgi:NADH-quinone oxidoreductase subunit J
VVGGGLAVVTLRNIIHSAIAMMVCFGSLAGMYLLLGAAIIAAAQVLIYLGAISVLILFAIMLTQTKDAPTRLVFQTQAGPASIAAIVVAIVIALAVTATDWGTVERGARLGTEIMSRILFQQFLFPFEIVSVLLLAAVIGGVFLAKREPGGPS